VRALGEALESKTAKKEALLSAMKTKFKALSTAHANAQHFIDQYLKLRAAALHTQNEDLEAAKRERSERQIALSGAERNMTEFLSKLSNQACACTAQR
jgi:hypothetical protein